MATNKKQEEFNLDEALSTAEGGDMGRMLKGVAEQIEPRAEFARQLEARLVDQRADDDMALGKVSSESKSEQPLLTLMQAPRPTRPLRDLSDRPRLRIFTRAGRAASVLMSLGGVAAVLLAFVFMASMFQVRKEAIEAWKTPTVASGTVVDALKLIQDFRLLHTLEPGPSTYGTEKLQLAWAPDGEILAAASGDTVQLWDRKSGQLMHTIVLPSSKFAVPSVDVIAWSPIANTLAVGTEGNTILLIDGATGEQLHAMVGPVPSSSAFYSHVKSITWSPDGKLLASSCEERFDVQPSSMDGVITIWDITTGKQAREIRIPGDKGNAAHVYYTLTWSPDGHTLASVSSGGVLRLWDGTTGKILHELGENILYSVGLIEWSPDGQTLAVANMDMQLWAR